MSQFLISGVAFLIAIGILIAVHEFGHFWVARRFGIKVLRFSLGFGKPLYSWYDRLGTEYVLSAIPLGGYVSLFGEQSRSVPPAERHMAFSHKPVLVRMLVLVAGPMFNLLFATLMYWLIFSMKMTIYIPILGNVPKDSIAGVAGLQSSQEIISIEGHPTPSWEAVSLQLLKYMGEDKIITLTVRDPHKQNKLETKSLDIGRLTDDSSAADWLENLGLVTVDPVLPIVEKVLPDYPAFEAGLVAGDLIEKIHGKVMHSRNDVVRYIQDHPHKPVTLDIARGEKKIKITVIPTAKFSKENNKDIGFIGVEFQGLKEIPKELTRTQYYSISEALSKAFKRTAKYSILTLEILKKMIMGKVSLQHVSGPLAIAKYAGASASIGVKQFLDFLALISISLGVLNLLPIPILDGGHLMYCAYELLTGRAVSEMAQTIGAWIGGIILVGFMMLAFYNDLMQLLR